MSVSLLDPNTQPKFTNALPSPPVIDATLGGSYTIEANQVDNFFMGLLDPTTKQPLYTTVYSYQLVEPDGTVVTGSLYGPTILAASGVPIHVTWVNNLPPIDPTLLPIDNSIHKANVTQPEPEAIPIVTHLHGGHNQAASDGHPDAWYTQNNAEKGPAWQTPIYTYDNSQQAATLIYHDHALGYTPQNVYAGLGGFYLIRDANLNELISDGVLPSGTKEIGMALQDHSFTAEGKLYMPGRALDDPIPQQTNPDGTQVTVADMLPPGYTGPVPTALPEFFGDFNLVNGMAWPKLDVAKGEYLFHYTNISDSRFYELQLSDPWVKVTLVGTDGGLLKDAKVISDGDGLPEAGENIIVAPGDRIDLVLDFTNAKGDVDLQNTGPAYEPFKGLGAASAVVTNAVPGVDPVGEVMKFTLNSNLTPFHSKLFDNPADLTPNVVLNPGFQALTEASATYTRKVGLYEMTDQFDRILPLLGTAENTIDITGNPVKAGAMLWDMPTTETPLLGSTEIWEIFNYTADAHPIHLHEVQYQVLGRYMMSQNDINGDGVVDQLDYTTAADLNHDGLVNDIGGALQLRPEDTGWQDTVWVGPGEALKIIEKFDLPGDYVWHCHILSHENNEMMRPLHVINTINGTDKKETLTGTDDIDSITAGKGNDIVNAGAGDDRFIAEKNDGNDTYNGGPGTDTLDMSKITKDAEVRLDGGFARGPQIGNDKLISIENVIGGSRNDRIIGNAGSNFLVGGAGADSLQGQGGDDRLWGQAGDDTLCGGAGADTFLYYRNLANTVDFGRNLISDFDPTQDLLEVDNTIFKDMADLVAHAKDTKAGVVITYDAADTITLRNNTLAGLEEHPDHFLFIGGVGTPTPALGGGANASPAPLVQAVASFGPKG